MAGDHPVDLLLDVRPTSVGWQPLFRPPVRSKIHGTLPCMDLWVLENPKGVGLPSSSSSLVGEACRRDGLGGWGSIGVLKDGQVQEGVSLDRLAC